MAEKRKKTALLQMRIHPVLRRQLELLAERNATNLTAEATIAIREYLKREGLWPPPRQERDEATDPRSEKEAGDSGAPE